MICPARNAALRGLQEVTFSNNDVFDYLGDDKCDAVALFTGRQVLAVAGPLGSVNVLTVFENNPDSMAVMVSAQLHSCTAPARPYPHR